MSAKILVVDDEPDLLRLIGFALELEGYQIVTAVNGNSALQKVQSEQPDLVILDVMLPDMSGVEVCQRLRARPESANLPIMMLSARAQVADKVKALQAGADEYITKPVDADEMTARVRAILKFTERLKVAAPPAKTARVLGFVGVKGGVGATTAALSVAAVLAQQNKKVVVAELTGGFSSFSAALKQTPTRNVTNLLRMEEGFSPRDVQAALQNTAFGARVLFGAQKPGDLLDMTAEQSGQLVTALETLADIVVLDFSFQSPAVAEAAAQRCSFVTLLVEPDPAAIQMAKVVIDQLRLWEVSDATMGAVVFNRTALAMAMQAGEIKRQLGCELIGVLPPAPDPAMAAQSRGTPLALYKPELLVATNLVQIANRLAAENIVGMRL
jgi:DNA-binding response OmpR family regulator